MTRRVVILVLFVCGLVVLWMVCRQHVSLEKLIAQEARLRGALSQHPWNGLLVGFAVYVVTSLIPGTTGKSLVVAWLYGFWPALVVVNFGLTTAALVSFGMSRWVGRDFVASRQGRRLVRVNAALEREGASYLFAARVLHVPFSLTNYVMGATRIRWRSFWWSTQLGILPGNIVFVYAGSQVPTLADLDQFGLSSLLSPGLIAAFVAVSVLPLFIRSLVHRMLSAARARRHVANG